MVRSLKSRLRCKARPGPWHCFGIWRIWTACWIQFSAVASYMYVGLYASTRAHTTCTRLNYHPASSTKIRKFNRPIIDMRKFSNLRYMPLFPFVHNLHLSSLQFCLWCCQETESLSRGRQWTRWWPHVTWEVPLPSTWTPSSRLNHTAALDTLRSGWRPTLISPPSQGV